MVIGAIDPLEGSVLIWLGNALAALGAWLVKNRYQTWLICAWLLVTLGVGLLFGFSALGGFGGTTGRPLWWALVLLPYPIGWIMGLLGAARSLWERPDSTTQHMPA